MYSTRTCSVLIAGWCLVIPLTTLKVQTPTVHKVYKGHVHRIAFSLNDRYLPSGGGDCRVRIWDTTKFNPEKDKGGATTKPFLDRSVKEASLIAVGEFDRHRRYSYRGIGGGQVLWLFVKVKSVLKGKETAKMIGFAQQLTNHRNQALFIYADPRKHKGDIMVLLWSRRIAEGDVWFLPVREHPPSWYPVDSDVAKYIRKKLK